MEISLRAIQQCPSFQIFRRVSLWNWTPQHLLRLPKRQSTLPLFPSRRHSPCQSCWREPLRVNMRWRDRIKKQPTGNLCCPFTCVVMISNLLTCHMKCILSLYFYVRSWNSIYFVLKPGQLSAYKDAKGFSHNLTYHGETPLSLHNAVCEALSSYKKKKQVFKLR